MSFCRVFLRWQAGFFIFIAVEESKLAVTKDTNGVVYFVKILEP